MESNLQLSKHQSVLTREKAKLFWQDTKAMVKESSVYWVNWDWMQWRKPNRKTKTYPLPRWISAYLWITSLFIKVAQKLHTEHQWPRAKSVTSTAPHSFSNRSNMQGETENGVAQTVWSSPCLYFERTGRREKKLLFLLLPEKTK